MTEFSKVDLQKLQNFRYFLVRIRKVVGVDRFLRVEWLRKMVNTGLYVKADIQLYMQSGSDKNDFTRADVHAPIYPTNIRVTFVYEC